ncbi:hypothetical protein BDD12DRAFT_833154 [Trichophaea hybrida]|nr:hypothetical protein BDD12DRAFT_833154 [Trichophaea hybrida]
MSFGYSIGDILLLSQLSYKLYGILTSDRQSAPSTLRELSTSVFGLRCALEHLSQHLSTSKLPPGTTKMHANLSLMITNCGDTLRELDKVLTRYEEKVIVKGKGTRGKMKREWNRIKWSVEEKGLSEIRGKIMQHTEGMQMVVDTFIWAEVKDGREEAREGTEKIEKLLEKIVQEGLQMKNTVNVMRHLIAGNVTPPTTTLPQQFSNPATNLFGRGAGSGPISLPLRIRGMGAVQHVPVAPNTTTASFLRSRMSDLEGINRQRAVAAKTPSKHLPPGQSAVPPPKRVRSDPQTDIPSYTVARCQADGVATYPPLNPQPPDPSLIARCISTFPSPS